MGRGWPLIRSSTIGFTEQPASASRRSKDMAENMFEPRRAETSVIRGELAIAATIDSAVAEVGGIVLHNRRMPAGAGDIDHIAIVPSGIYVIDTKGVTGRVVVRSRWRQPPLLFIAGRDRTVYLDRLDRQVHAVRDALAGTRHASSSVIGALCFTHADLPLLRTLEMRGHLLLYRKALADRLTAAGPLSHDHRVELAASLDKALLPA